MTNDAGHAACMKESVVAHHLKYKIMESKTHHFDQAAKERNFAAKIINICRKRFEVKTFLKYFEDFTQTELHLLFLKILSAACWLLNNKLLHDFCFCKKASVRAAFVVYLLLLPHLLSRVLKVPEIKK